MVTRPPAPLLALLGAVLVLVSTWALVTPPFQVPDEPEHFSYAQTIAELGRLPGGAGNPVSTELSRANDAVNGVQAIFTVRGDPTWAEAVDDRFAGGPRDDGGGPNNASTYPPLYYAVEALPYLAGSGGDVFTRLALARLVSGLWLLLTVTAAWLLCGELFDRRRLPQLVGAGTVGLWPLMTFVSAGVNPDALLVALWTLVLWMGVKVLKRGLTWRRGLALGAFSGLALITKISTFALVPAVLAVLALAGWRARRTGGVAAVALAVVALALPLGVYSAATSASGSTAYGQTSDLTADTAKPFVARQFASYLWQFYLPRLGSMQPIDHQYPVISQKPVLNLWLGTGSAVFGWVNVWFPRGVYWAIGVALLALLALFAAASARWWARAGEGRLRRLAPAAFLAGVALVTVGALHYTDYTFFIGGRGPFIHGRYLLPLAGVLAAVVGWALLAVPERRRALAAGVWLGALVALQVASLGLVLGRWYA